MYEINGVEIKEWEVARHDIGDNDDWTPDPFPWYVLVSTTNKTTEEGMPILAVSFMTTENDTPGPIFTGTARALYKALASLPLAPDHMGYIGFELGRAEMASTNGLDYTQS